MSLKIGKEMFKDTPIYLFLNKKDIFENMYVT